MAEDSIENSSKKEEETPIHVLCYCEALMRTRSLVRGVEKNDKPHEEGNARGHLPSKFLQKVFLQKEDV